MRAALCGREPRNRAPTPHEDVDDVAVLIHGTPQIPLLPLDLHEHFVQIPGVAHAAPAASQPPRIVEPERQTPLANRLIRNGDTSFREEMLDIAETQAKPVVEPDGVTDDGRGKSVPAIAGLLADRHPTLPATVSTSQCLPATTGGRHASVRAIRGSAEHRRTTPLRRNARRAHRCERALRRPSCLPRRR
jgi:hypothetical protein